MNAVPKNNVGVAGGRRPGYSVRARILFSAIVFFLAGVVLSAVWFSGGAQRKAAPVAADPQLSDATKAVLQHLDAPVEIRFYSRLDPSSVQDSVQAYAGRVDQLLAQYEQAAGNRVTVTRYNSASNFDPKAASADGIKAFNINKGDSCFLGIAVVCDGQKESLRYLAPEWEQALEPDLTRAIVRATEARPGAQGVARADTATVDAVKVAIPNIDSVSLEDGTSVLRNASLAQFMQAAQKMEADIKAAQEQILRSPGGESDAAAEKLRKIQKDGAEKLQQIALNSHAQILALQQLKKGSP